MALFSQIIKMSPKKGTKQPREPPSLSAFLPFFTPNPQPPQLWDSSVLLPDACIPALPGPLPSPPLSGHWFHGIHWAPVAFSQPVQLHPAAQGCFHLAQGLSRWRGRKITIVDHSAKKAPPWPGETKTEWSDIKHLPVSMSGWCQPVIARNLAMDRKPWRWVAFQVSPRRKKIHNTRKRDHTWVLMSCHRFCKMFWRDHGNEAAPRPRLWTRDLWH